MTSKIMSRGKNGNYAVALKHEIPPTKSQRCKNTKKWDKQVNKKLLGKMGKQELLISLTRTKLLYESLYTRKNQMKWSIS